MSYVLPLIDTEDAAERIVAQVADIIAAETALQKQLALAEGKDPQLWDLRVFLDRTDVIQEFAPDLTTPVISVWRGQSKFDRGRSTQGLRVAAVTSVFVDCYGYGVSEPGLAGGQEPADYVAMNEAERAARLVRHIIGSPKYRRLMMPDVVWERWISTTDVLRVESADTVERVVVLRHIIEVSHNEETEQPSEETFEAAHVNMRHEPSGLVVAEMEIK